MAECCVIEQLTAGGAVNEAALTSKLAALVPAAQDCEPQEIARGVYFLQGGTRYFQEGTLGGPAGAVRSLMCNNGWIVLEDEVLLVDANMPGRADVLLAAVRRTSDKPVRYLFNTHHHGDHLYGNRVIVERTGAGVIAHEGVVRELRRYETGYFGGPPGRWEQVAKARPDVAATPLMLPRITFDSRLTLGGGRIQLCHLGFGHTRGDGIVWLADERIAFTGDLVVNGAFNIVRDAQMTDWVDTLAALQSLGPSTLCPGHGALGDATTLARQRSFFIALIREVRARVAAGLTRERVLEQVDDIRRALAQDPAAAYLIPREAELPVLSLTAQVERTYDQLQASGTAP